MLKIGQIYRCQGLDKLGSNVAAMRNPPNVCFSRFRFKKTIVLFRNENSL